MPNNSENLVFPKKIIKILTRNYQFELAEGPLRGLSADEKYNFIVLPAGENAPLEGIKT